MGCTVDAGGEAVGGSSAWATLAKANRVERVMPQTARVSDFECILE
jgi:hypothetical protein